MSGGGGLDAMRRDLFGATKRPPWVTPEGWEQVKEQARVTGNPVADVLRVGSRFEGWVCPPWMPREEWEQVKEQARVTGNPDIRAFVARAQNTMASELREKLFTRHTDGESPGACRLCGAIRDGVAPDGKRYKCHNCGSNHVAGFKEWLRDSWVILDVPSIPLSDRDIELAASAFRDADPEERRGCLGRGIVGLLAGFFIGGAALLRVAFSLALVVGWCA